MSDTTDDIYSYDESHCKHELKDVNDELLTWRSKNGKQVKIYHMGIMHLYNCINLFENGTLNLNDEAMQFQYLLMKITLLTRHLTKTE